MFQGALRSMVNARCYSSRAMKLVSSVLTWKRHYHRTLNLIFDLLVTYQTRATKAFLLFPGIPNTRYCCDAAGESQYVRQAKSSSDMPRLRCGVITTTSASQHIVTFHHSDLSALDLSSLKAAILQPYDDKHSLAYMRAVTPKRNQQHA